MVPARGFAGNHGVNGLMLQRKCGCGSQGGKCDCRKPEERTKSRGLQTKLAVSDASDRFEQEADRVAEQVLAAPVQGSVETAPLRIQRVASQPTGSVDAAPSSVEHVLSNSGRPLDSTIQGRMEQRFGYDFSSVRVHTGAAAETSARDVNAQAYTVGNNIVFGAGRFAPTTIDGQRLIAHELTHVVQQSGTNGNAIRTKLQRKVVDDDKHLPCRDTEGRGVQVVADLEDKAARLAESAASKLRERPLAKSTHDFVWKRFRRNYNDPRDRCRFIPEIADRFDAIARGIRNTEVEYGCVSSGEPSSQCHGHFAFTKPGLFGGTRIDLCSRFWANPNERVVTILHEWAHYIFEPRGVLDEPKGGFDTAECYNNFATELDGKTVKVFADASQCEPNTEAPPALDPAKINLPCPGNTFLNVSALSGVAANVPGPSHFAGVGVSLLFPVTRLHDWEAALGVRYLRFAPEEDRGAQMLVLRGDLSFRKQPWRFGSETGAHLEGGILAIPSSVGGSDVHKFVGAGVSRGYNIRISEEKALRIVGEVGVGRAFATDDEKGFWVGKAGLSIGITFE